MPDQLPEKPSKSAAKRAHKERQKQVEMLCGLKEEKYRMLSFPERVGEELAVARRMKPSSARNRQIRHITKLMSDLDEDTIAQMERLLGRV